MKINHTANSAKRIIALIALIALCTILLAPGASAAAAKRLSIDDIVGRYLYAETEQGISSFISIAKDGNKLIHVTRNGDRIPYDKYDPSTGVAKMYIEYSDRTLSKTSTFARVGDAIGVSLEDTNDYYDRNKADWNYRLFGIKLPSHKGAIPIDQVEGTYEYQGPGSKVVHQLEMVRSGDKLIGRWEDGGENEYSYDSKSALAYKLTKGKNDRFVLTAWNFTNNDGVIEVFIQEGDITRNKSCTLSTFRGQKINLVGSGGPAAEYSTDAQPKLADFQWYINDIQKTGSPQKLKGVKFIKDFELVKGGWKGIIFDNEANLAKAGYISTFNLDISGSAKSVKLTPEWHSEYDSFNEKDVRGDATGTDPFFGTWGSGKDYGFFKGEDEYGDNKINIGMFYELNGKQYALGVLTWWDGWENYVALVRP